MVSKCDWYIILLSVIYLEETLPSLDAVVQQAGCIFQGSAVASVFLSSLLQATGKLWISLHFPSLCS